MYYLHGPIPLPSLKHLFDEQREKKKNQVLSFIRKNSGKFNGPEITTLFDMWRGPPEYIFEELEKENLIKYNRDTQKWCAVKTVGVNRVKGKKRKNRV